MLKEILLTIIITVAIFFVYKSLEFAICGEVQDRMIDDILMIIAIHLVREEVNKRIGQ